MHTQKGTDTMKRDLRKALRDYDKSFSGTTHGAFYLSDLDQILEITEFKRRLDVVGTIHTALKIGYVIGQRAAKRKI